MAFDNGRIKRMVRSWCIAAGMTYDDLAAALGIPLTTLKSWIYGQNRISCEDAARICDVFGKSLDELAGRMEFDPASAIGREQLS